MDEGEIREQEERDHRKYLVKKVYERGYAAGLREAADVAKNEAEKFDGKNADRYWQSKRIEAAILALAEPEKNDA